MNQDFNKVCNLYTNTDISSLRKYKYTVSNMNVFEFKVGDFEKVRKLIDMGISPSIYIIKEGKEVYIGQTDRIKERLKNHIKNKDFITEETNIYVITSEGFNKNICLEIESRTIKLFVNSIRNFKVHNENELNNSYLGSSDILNSDRYMEFINEIYFLLRFNLKPRLTNKDVDDSKNELFHFKSAKIKIAEDGYILLKGSKIFMDSYGKYESSCKGTIKLRDKLAKSKIIENGELQEDLFWQYPSTLATLASGKSENGYTAWKRKDNKTLDDCIERAN